MDKKYTIDEQCYIVSLDNGIRREEPITIDIINSFKDGSLLVQLNQTVFGVFKDNNSDPETMYIDDLDIIKADIAELLDIDHEDVKRIVTEDKVKGNFTLLNYSKDIETRISANTVINHIIKYINQGIITGEEAMWLTKVLQYQSEANATCLKNPTEIEDVIYLGIYSLIKEIELQAGSYLDDRTKRAIEKSYIRMILFDFLVGRKYRGLDYYLISKINEFGKPVWLDAYLSPISVSSSVDKTTLVNDNEYLLNNKVVDRNVLIQVLFNKYFREIKKLTEALNDAKKLYSDAMGRIIYNNTDLTRASIVEESILNNLNRIAKLQAETEAKLDKEQKSNKVERTMATQSLNVRVTLKLDLIQKKYPINPKDHPELKELKNKTPDDIKLVVEEENAGFATTPVLIGLVSLICGVGMGIAYVLLTFSA